MERWGEAETHEFYGFDLTDQKKQKAMQDLIGCLNEIESYGRRRIPSKIRWAAKELRTILRKSYENVGSYQESKKRVESEDVWVAVPVDLPRFFPDRKLLKENDERWVLKEQELWHEALRASVSIHAVPSVIHPVLPVFQDFPHVAMVTSWDPLGFAQVFDNRYFLVSRELNLLSTLIFA